MAYLTRKIVTQFMLDQLADLQKKEQVLAESNKALRMKLEESTMEPLQLSWEAGEQSIPYNNQIPSRSEGFYQPLRLNSSLQIGYNPVGPDELHVAAPTAQNVNGFIPGWML
ncbi:hypothetical protein HYC85_004952 [Camellia sinensis]|uniref:MADS-box domain-containing protein n=1 Tax=Camellia sinensis TaxID=4442 RepID=A0A7J7HZA6_CAMSI|nr:hypothetical protein HYC85_004952 [Camellia sinensis]